MKKPHLTKATFLFLAFFLGMASFYFFKSENLKKELREAQAHQQELESYIEARQALLHIDSMLVDGDDYPGALKAYRAQLNDKSTSKELRLRISLTEKLTRLTATKPHQDYAKLERLKELDSLQALATIRPKELQQYDSLSFALEKTKVQLVRMKRQLKQKSFGEYLTFTNAKGSQMHYVGQVKNGKANGYGVALFNTGSRYEGQWKDNQRHGNGTFYWKDGERYEGEYQNDKRNGQGTYFWANGERFVGLWKGDERTGEGIFYGKEGDVVASGVWEDDELVQADKL
ncbi:MORN repeat-containing protein [Allomuricauda sp. SCSIO 65647]|uniref:MORN repeat-containing protein n=1 Tax=Allomuricauda sp. SCSIO 65647 TaxID=2908843 RepID=UPI001F426A03|nr:hypothetical protein [Muricauda sp. SCSIO 65647]UJH67343.1 hypothetical protein L0P89_15510 [Muricauda sp. SCSIO 65647]